MHKVISAIVRRGERRLPFCILFPLLLFVSAYGAEKPPESIYGTYTRSVEACFVASTDTGSECEGYVNNVIEIKPSRKGTVKASIELFFFNGHTCSFEGKGVWGGKRLVLHGDDCNVFLRFRDNAVMTQAEERCYMSHCGVRGSLGGAKLYKRKGLKGEEPAKPIIEAIGEPLNTLWDANDELNRTYKGVFNGLNGAERTTLRNEQLRWISGRDRKCESALPKSGKEEWLRYVAADETRAQCVLDFTVKRTTELTSRGQK